MFSKAYEIASKFTNPVLISYRFFDGTIESGIGSFVILNEEGWIITAAHILDSAFAHQQNAIEIQAFNEKIAEIEEDHKLTTKAKIKRKKRLKINNKWITNQSMWWGRDGHTINEFKLFRENDIAVGKIENFNPDFCKEYPVFKNPNDLKNGTSLCKLGYPFYDVMAQYEEGKNMFQFDPSIFPIPRFPIEGIYTRNILLEKGKEINIQPKFIETSTPGLRGQSGGPTFDTDGRIWAIQSQTRHLPLGFTPKVKKDNKEVEENQFLNVGWGAHVESILEFLKLNNISFKVE